MPIFMTKAIRPVGAAMNGAIGEYPKGPFNYGLYFNKWLHVENGDRTLGETGRKPWACPGADEAKLVEHREKVRDFNPLLDNFETSIALFNGLKNYRRNKAVAQQRNGVTTFREEPDDVPFQGSWNRASVRNLLASRHKSLEAIADSFSSVGYEYIPIEAEMFSPLVIGLGNEHPTEKGFHFDWTLGIPVIPATGIKGVVRLAWLVDRLNEKSEVEAMKFWAEISGRWKEGRREAAKPAESILPEEARQLFGSGEITRPEERKQANSRGKVIFLDALPATLPRLKAEIMNCHYPDYLNKQPGDREFRGPTEDQNPNPQKFWAVSHWEDAQEKKPLKFVFRLLIHRDIVDNANRKKTLLDAVDKALNEHGLGAKTAIGHGRYKNGGSLSGDKNNQSPNQPTKTATETQASFISSPAPEQSAWEGVTLDWNPGNQTLSATASDGKKAVIKLNNDRTMLTHEIFTRLKKGKSVKARVTVEPIGGRNFRIVKVEA